MKKILISSFSLLCCAIVYAQPPSNSNLPTGVPDTISAKSDPLYPVDTLGGGKQVPHNSYHSKGEGRVPSDSTRNRLAQGGKSARDKEHVKQYPARKDTTHVHYKSSKSVKRTHKQSANTKAKQTTN